MKVHVSPYNPLWATKFSAVKADLEVILAGVPITAIEHVGSTSVPGLFAKPILDIDIITPLAAISEARAALSKAGYLDRGEMGVPGRIMFRQPGDRENNTVSEEEGKEMRRNTYVMTEGCLASRNHLDVKRVLLEDEELRKEYGEFKKALTLKEWKNIDAYTIGKNDVLFKVLRKAGWSEEELAEVEAANRA